MIKYNGAIIQQNHFPDGTLHLKEFPGYGMPYHHIEWHFEGNEELFTLICLTKHIQSHGIGDIILIMPYVPNARMDRVKHAEDVFTLKYFADVINGLNFKEVRILDPHSYVTPALIERVQIVPVSDLIYGVMDKLHNPMVFYPDEGAMKRYDNFVVASHAAFGIKRRNWVTGEILGLDIAGDIDEIKGKDILIVDDICSRGGTFYHSAKKLKELGAGNIYLCVTHCENTILQGELLSSGLIEKVFTTDSILTITHPKIEVIQYEL